MKSNSPIAAVLPGTAVLVMTVLAANGAAQYERQKRSRGEGLYQCASANTVAAGDLWITGRGIGFVWDDPDPKVGLRPFAFVEGRSELGLFGMASIFAESRLSSYFWGGRPQFGTVGGGAKFTLPNNSDLRVHGVGLELKYTHNLVANFPSIAGYRVQGSGFSPEGFMAEGGSFQFKFLYDRDYIARSSKLPFKAFANAGMRIPVEQWLTPYSQYLLALGFAYVGLSFDAFIEFSMEGFPNASNEPKKFDWQLAHDIRKVWEVGFTENPMFLTPGVRIRYEGGTVLYCAVPLLLSTNMGSSMTDEDKYALDVGGFPGELARGISDPFDPWYAKWRIVGEISLPLLFHETGAEMRRAFLLMKNRKKEARIDLDRLKPNEKSPGTEEDEADAEKRLEQIRKRREQIKSSE